MNFKPALQIQFVVHIPRKPTVVPNGNFQKIIKCWQELKEVNLAYIDKDDDIEFLTQHISPNIVRLNLSHQDVEDDHI